jgi:eukaryotic-like serine/threonine-protein kinase
VVVTLSGKGGAGDQAAHAARCALALRSHMVMAHVALATGLSEAGRGAVGEVIERAAAILAGARGRSGEIGEETLGGQSPVFLDETTAGLLDMRFDVGGDDRGLFIRGLRDRDAKPRTLLGKPTPFVGRERELSTLLGIFEECVYEPVARAVLVTGQPGGGKSRLGTEFLRRVREDHGAEVWLARGDAMTEGSPFSILARLIRRGCGITGGEPLVVRQQKLKARVARHVPEKDVQRVSEFLGEIASVHFPDQQSVQLHAARQDTTLMGDQMRRAFCDIVLADAARSPLVLVLEDLHWGDLPSVNFVDSALRTAAEQPFMVLGIARGEVHEAFPHLWEQRSLQEIRLGPLMRRAGERLVKEVLGDLSPDETNRLLDRAAGNVFYLEELIRAYAEGTGRGSSRPSTYPRSTTPPPAPSSGSLDTANDWSLPGTVLAMVEARLERLDPMARRVLRAASIFGEVFWRGSVLALTGGEYKASEVDDWLAELARKEIVQRRDNTRFPGEHEYFFRHAIVRDAAYHMLTTEDVTLGHKLAGEWLERVGEHEAILLGEHYERGGQATKAATFYARAAAEALEGNDFAAAKLRAERAISAGAEGAQLGRLHLLLAEASRWAVDHEAAIRHARIAMRELPAATDEWFSAAAEAVDATVTLGHVEETKSTAELVRRASDGAAMTAGRVIATSRIVTRLTVLGAYDNADTLLAPIERGAAELVTKEPAARGFLLAAQVARANLRGDIEDAASLGQQAVACFDVVGDLRNAAIQRHHAGYSLVQLGIFTMAEGVLRDAIAQAEKLGLVGVVNDARLHLGLLFGRAKRTDEALDIIREAVAGYAVQRDKSGEGRARAYLAAALHIAKDHAGAEDEILRALPLLERMPPYRAALLGLMALALADKGDNDSAYLAGSEAMRIFEQVGGTVEGESVIRVAYAEALFAKGDVEGAKNAIRIARDRLLERANRIKNPEWRKNFIGTIQEHNRTLARAGEWLI